MSNDTLQTCCSTGGCNCSGIDGETVVAMRYMLRQAADAVRAAEIDLAENMIHKTLQELERYTGD